MSEPGPQRSAWSVVIAFGVVSLAVDLVADGARSVSGPLLAALGASAFVTSVVTGVAEAAGFGLRLVSGPLVDRTRRYWGFTIGGYALTAVCVPLLAITPWIGAAGLAVAAALIIGERVGKAVRSPAKTALLAPAAMAVGGGRGFGVHKLLDQVGAFGGPLLVAAIAAITGALWPAFALLAIPAAVALVVLVVTRARVPDTGVYEPTAHRPATTGRGGRVPRALQLVGGSAALTTFGMVGFGLISFHLADRGLVPIAAVPLVFAVGMAAAAVAAVVVGRIYDRTGAGVLLAVPVFVAAIPVLVFADSAVAVVVGAVLWGAATGVQDSTIKALVADLVPSPRRGTAYGVVAVYQGAGTFVGAAVAGALYPDAVALSLLTVPAQLLAIVLLVVVLRQARRARAS